MRSFILVLALLAGSSVMAQEGPFQKVVNVGWATFSAPLVFITQSKTGTKTQEVHIRLNGDWVTGTTSPVRSIDDYQIQIETTESTTNFSPPHSAIRVDSLSFGPDTCGNTYAMQNPHTVVVRSASFYATYQTGDLVALRLRIAGETIFEINDWTERCAFDSINTRIRHYTPD